MARTPQEQYDYQSKRIDTYTEQFNEIVETMELHRNITAISRDKLINLFTWFGRANWIKSKAHQELKTKDYAVND